jgi:hypothetical protein
MTTCKKCGGEVKTVSSPQNGNFTYCVKCGEVVIPINPLRK